jgi:iron complex transport system permease protein
VFAVAAIGALVARIVVFPRALSLDLPRVIVELRSRAAMAGLVAGAGFGLAAVGEQARGRQPMLDASLTGPAWGALPGLLVPGPWYAQAAVALVGAGLVARWTGKGDGLERVLARGIAVAGVAVSLSALVLFLGPGFTASTAQAFLYAALGGLLPQATFPRAIAGGVLVLASGVLAWTRWRAVLLTRTGLSTADRTLQAIGTLASAGAVLVAGVVAGVGLIATRIARALVGEHPRALVPGAALVGATLVLVLDGISQAVTYPGQLPVGVVTTAIGSLLLARKVLPDD